MAQIDHTTITRNGPPATPGPASRRWWELKPTEACGAVTACLDALKQQEEGRGVQLMRSMRLYGNNPLSRFYGMSNPTTETVQSSDRISCNISQSVTDTVTSKIGKNKPDPRFLTSGGDYKQQRKAKNLNKFMHGVFYENKAHQLGIDIFRDGCVLGDGLAHVFTRNGRVKYARVLSPEIKIDEMEAAYGYPRQLHWPRLVDRLELAARFPAHRKEIMDAPGAWEKDNAPSRPHISDMIWVRQSWHLPSGPDANDGKTIITTDAIALTPMMDWNHDFFPFARFPWALRTSGYWGQGLVEQIQPLQVEVNKILMLVQRSYHLGGSFKILMEMGSKVATEHLNNQIGAIIKYQGAPPQYIVPPLLPPEIYQHLQWLVQAAFEQAGISRMSAGGTKPAGLNSGRALIEYEDIESDRFQLQGRKYEQFYLDLARISIALIKDLFESGEVKKYEVRSPASRWVETVDWKKIDLDEDQYVMQCFPVSSLPNEPAGRLETVTEMIQAGLVDPRTGKRLLNFPDIEQEENLAGAAEDFLTKKLDEMVDQDEDEWEPYAPEPDDNPPIALQLAQQYYLAGKRDNLEEEKLERLRVFMQQCKQLVQAAMPPPPMAAGQPQNPPVPPQQSDLVQNVPGMAA